MPAKLQVPGGCNCTGSCLLAAIGGTTPITFADARITYGGATATAVFSSSSSFGFWAYTGPVWDTGYFVCDPTLGFGGGVCATPYYARFLIVCNTAGTGFNLYYWSADGPTGAQSFGLACRIGTPGGAGHAFVVSTGLTVAVGLGYSITWRIGFHTTTATLLQP